MAALGRESPGGEEKASPKKPALKDDPKYKKYFKMLAMHLPRGAVEQKMRADGLDVAVLDMDPDKPMPGSGSGDGGAGGEDKKVDTRVKIKDDPQFAKFFKLRDLGMAKAQVSEKMKVEGLDPKVLDMDPNTLVEGQASTPTRRSSRRRSQQSPSQQSPSNKNIRRKRLHWKGIDKTRLKEGDNIWLGVHEDMGTSADGPMIEIDDEEFQRLFVSVEDERKNKDAEAGGEKKATNEKIHLVDSKRSLNGGIALARLKMSYDAVKVNIKELRGESFTTDHLVALAEFLPTDEEQSMIQNFLDAGGDGERLAEVESFMAEMLDVPDCAARIRCLSLQKRFKEAQQLVMDQVRLLENACEGVKENNDLKVVFHGILRLGNKLNAGQGDEVLAFTLDSLLKLKDAKAFDKKTTVMHYLIRIIRRSNASVLKFYEHLPDMVEAAKVSSEQINSELRNLERQLGEAQTVLKKDAEAKKKARQEAKELLQQTRAAAGLPPDSDSDSDDDSATVDSRNELRRLNLGNDSTPYATFASHAKDRLMKVSNEVALVQEKYRDVLSYFGEDPKLNSQEFFKTLNTFCNAFKGATEELEAIEERERQRIRREEEAEKRKKAIAEKIGKKLVLQSKTTGAEKSSSPKDKPPEEALSPLPANENVGGGDDESDDNESSHSSYHAGRMTLMLEGARRMRTATQGADSDEDAANIDENSSDSSDDSSGSGFTSSDEEDKGTVGRVFSFQRADSAGDEEEKKHEFQHRQTNLKKFDQRSIAGLDNVDDDHQANGVLNRLKQRTMSIGDSDDDDETRSSGASSADFKFKPVRGGRRSGVHETQGHSYKMPNLHKLKDMQSKAEAMKSADSRLGAVGADESDEDEDEKDGNREAAQQKELLERDRGRTTSTDMDSGSDDDDDDDDDDRGSFHMAPVRRGRRSVMHEGAGQTSKMPNMHKMKDLKARAEAERAQQAASKLLQKQKYAGAVGDDGDDRDNPEEEEVAAAAQQQQQQQEEEEAALKRNRSRTMSTEASSSSDSEGSFQMAPVRRGRRSVMHEGHGHSSKMPNMHKINDMHHKNNLSRLSERGSELEEARKRGLSTELPPDRESSMRLSMFGNDLQKELRGRLATGSLPAPPPPNAAAPPLLAAPPPVPALAAATAPAEGKAPSRAVPPPPAGRPKGEVVDAKLAHQNNKTKASALLQAPPPPPPPPPLRTKGMAKGTPGAVALPGMERPSNPPPPPAARPAAAGAGEEQQLPPATPLPASSYLESVPPPAEKDARPGPPPEIAAATAKATATATAATTRISMKNDTLARRASGGLSDWGAAIAANMNDLDAAAGPGQTNMTQNASPTSPAMRMRRASSIERIERQGQGNGGGGDDGAESHSESEEST